MAVGPEAAPIPELPPAPAPSGAAPTNQGPTYTSPINPATVTGQSELSTPAPPAMAALPVTSGDSSTSRKFYTLSASLREIYDDNVNTSSTNAQSSFETELSPSVLVDFPNQGSDFNARYTLDLTYYTVGNNNGSGTGTGKNASEFDVAHEVVATYTHAFSDRFDLILAESFRYFTEPSIDQSTGTNYQNGPYATNIFNASFTSQWTPLIGSSTSFSNTVVNYQDSIVGQQQNSIENTGTQTINYSILPKVSTGVGATVDNITYDTANRGYTTYTGFGEGTWQVLPSLSVTGQGGGTYIVPLQGQDSVAPYGALTISWTLGERSSLTFNYAHSVTPSDEIGANGQISDRFNSTFRYDITTRLSSHLQGSFTHANTSNGLAGSGTANNSEEEDDYYLDTGLTYQYNTYLNLDGGITLSGVDSNNSNTTNNSYTRDEVYMGVRGTY